MKEGKKIFNFKNYNKGMMLISILMLLLLLIMLTTAMITIASGNLNITGNSERKTKALLAAEAGVEYALYQLNNNSSWMPSYGAPENLANGQSFDFTYAFNNLKGSSRIGSTPAYSYEIISEGNYKEYKHRLRAIFVREDNFIYGMCAGGPLQLSLYGLWDTPRICTEKTPGINGPGRVQSNSYIHGSPPYLQVDLRDGFMSACSNIYLPDMPGSSKKEGVCPVKIPDIDITQIITNKNPFGDPNCVILADNTFYLAGFFEYETDPLVNPAAPYCIPHSAPYDISADREIYGPYKVGIAYLSPETEYMPFLMNRQDAPFFTNLYDYYTVDFREYPAGGTASEIDAFNDTLESETGMRMSYDPGTHEITLTLEKDIYINTTNGLFETDYKRSGPPDYLSGMYDSSVTLNFNDHIIFGNKFFLGIPPVGTGVIASNKTVDIINTYTSNLVILSEESVRLLQRSLSAPSPYFPIWTSGMTSFNGIIYAKDDIVLQNSFVGFSGDATTWEIKGAIVCKDIHPNNCLDSPLTSTPGSFPSSNMVIIGNNLFNLKIAHTYDGLDTITTLRGDDFKVRKAYCEVYN